MQRHSADTVSLMAGLLFVVVGALLVARRLDVLTDARWLVPSLLIAAALAMFATASWSVRRRP